MRARDGRGRNSTSQDLGIDATRGKCVVGRAATPANEDLHDAFSWASEQDKCDATATPRRKRKNSAPMTVCCVGVLTSRSRRRKNFREESPGPLEPACPLRQVPGDALVSSSRPVTVCRGQLEAPSTQGVWSTSWLDIALIYHFHTIAAPLFSNISKSHKHRIVSCYTNQLPST